MLIKRRLLIAASLAAGIWLLPARACNPEFPSVLLRQSDAELLSAPVGDFCNELSRIPAQRDPKVKAIPAGDLAHQGWVLDSVTSDQTDAIALKELRAALPATAAGSKVVAAYQSWRAALRKDAQTAGPAPAGLPGEFALYEQGALAWHRKDLAAARDAWTKLLALPEKSRRLRTVWAAYMIGRTWSDADPAQAIRWFTQARALQAAGFADALGLAAVSLGWEARAQWQLKNCDAAVELFLEEFHAGDETAPWSLRDLAVEFLTGDDARLAAAAHSPAARQIVTAYLVAQGGPAYASQPEELPQKAARWMTALRDINVQDLRGADRLAWVAYSAGDPAAADRWLRLGGTEGEKTPLGQWIRAKLLLREGKIDAAVACLANAAAAFPPNEEWNDAAGGSNTGDLPWKPAAHAAGELALLKLGRAQFVDALDLLYRNHFWEDAAYIAERVLTADELKAYVDKNFPHHDPGTNNYMYIWETEKGAVNPKDADHGIRYLLARRLTRLGRWKEARAYYPAEFQPLLDQYIAGIRDGNDEKKSNADRAAALWAAAKLARNKGMELMGTELAPDGAIEGGNFEFAPDEGRVAVATQPADHRLSPVTAEEIRRLNLSPDAQPDKRFHYRYIAADHAWSAAQLMPGNTDALAQLLNEAGSWLAARDPSAADRFYKALVTRCPNTALGREAASLKWFPVTKTPRQ